MKCSIVALYSSIFMNFGGSFVVQDCVLSLSLLLLLRALLVRVAHCSHHIVSWVLKGVLINFMASGQTEAWHCLGDRRRKRGCKSRNTPTTLRHLIMK